MVSRVKQPRSAQLVKLLSIGIVAMLLVALALSWSWTFTPLGRLDYRAALLAKAMSLQAAPAVYDAAARVRANQMVETMLSAIEPHPDVRFEDRQIPGPDGQPLPIRIYWPQKDGVLPLYLDIHGGGWWMGDGFAFHDIQTHLAHMAEAIVVSVDYRLAPEHPFPAALDDSYTALLWLHANAASLGGDPQRIAVGGESAGGNLAAAVALRARDQGGPALRFQMLSVPSTDLSDTHHWPSYDETGDDYGLTVTGIRQVMAMYVPKVEQRTHPYVSPLLADDLADLPPALVITALFDPLRDQGEAYANRLRQAGVPVTLHREDGALHGFMGSPERARRIQEMSAEAIRRALYH